MSAKPPLVILGNPENRRVEFARHAAESLGWRGVRVVPWRTFLSDPEILIDSLRPDSWLRIESPGENFEVEKALLRLGAWKAGTDGFERLTPEEADALPFRQGEILPMRQWHLGWRIALARVDRCLAEAVRCRAMNPPGDIVVMFDKARCHEILGLAEVPRPRLLGLPASYEHLREIMRAAGCGRVFLKPCHSSSASGVVALETGRTGVRAYSTVEMAGERGRLRLFNSLTVREYRDPRNVTELVDAVCRQRSLAERWFPKAGHDGGRFDLRVLVISGRAAHTVMRQSAGPITNLHLGNRRGDLEGLRRRMGDDAWRRALEVAERAAATFPTSLYVAVDLLVAPGFHRFAVAEVNAFGDLLPNLLHEGRDTYTAELARLLEAPPAQVSTSGW